MFKRLSKGEQDENNMATVYSQISMSLYFSLNKKQEKGKGKMNKENKKYELVVGKKRIEVSEEVYKAYYKEREHEKYSASKKRNSRFIGPNYDL